MKMDGTLCHSALFGVLFQIQIYACKVHHNVQSNEFSMYYALLNINLMEKFLKERLGLFYLMYQFSV